MKSLTSDLRFAARTLRKTPGFTLVAILSLALGIGANTAIFSLIHAVLLRALPYPNPERIVAVYDVQPNYGNAPMSYPEYADWRDKSQVFETLAAEFEQNLTLSNVSSPEQVPVLRVSANYLDLLGVRPFLGRNFRREEEPAAAPRVVIVTYSFWKSRLGGDANVLGRTLTLNDTVAEIVGVLPADYQPLSRADVLMPLRLSPATMADRGSHFMDIHGRLRAGLQVDQGRRELVPLAKQVQKASSTGHGIFIARLKDDVTREADTPLILMFSAVGFILLIGCANVANLFLARAAGRQREIALRGALGAGRWRIVRQLLTESTAIALAGGALGLLVAQWTMAALITTLGPRLPRANEIGMDSTVLIYALLVALAVGVLFGLAPARILSRASLTSCLGEGGRSVAGAGGTQRRVLVTSEVALAVVLMAGAGLAIRSFSRLLNVPRGFDAGHVLTFGVNLSLARYQTPAQRAGFFSELRARLAALPGVQTVGLSSDLPLTGAGTDGDTPIEGRTFPADAQPTADKRIVSPGFFSALRAPMVRGRDFSERDRAGSPPVAIINEAFARKYFPNEDPIGKRISFAWGMDGFEEIVGVVGNIKQESLAGEEHRAVYVCYTQRPDSRFRFAVRTRSDPASLVSAARSALLSLDPTAPMTKVEALEDIVSESVRDQRASVLLLASLGGLALLLTAIGIYSVLAYTVAAQTREIGVRMALGASRASVLKKILSSGVRLAAVGAGIGLAAALALTRLMRSLLFGIEPNDPATFAGVTAVLLAVALAACLIPAWRAMRVDPVVALRHE